MTSEYNKFINCVARLFESSHFVFSFQRYGVRIRDVNQPMLVSKSSARDRRAGAEELVYLVPELCTMTGLTDQMR